MRLEIFFLGLVMIGGKQCSKQPNSSSYNNQKIIGSKPIYSTDPALKLVTTDTAHHVKNAGKIYAYQNYLLQCEVGEGIHIIDNTNPATAKRIAFIKVMGCNEISIKNNYLYTNSYKDLVTVDISNISHPVETQRIANAFNVTGYSPEPTETGYYECVNPSKGVVIGWTKDSIYPYCYKQ